MGDNGKDVSILGTLISKLTTIFSVRSGNLSYSGRRGGSLEARPSTPVVTILSSVDRVSLLSRIICI